MSSTKTTTIMDEERPTTLNDDTHARCVLAVLWGPDAGLRGVVHHASTVGRNPSCELPLSDHRVSWTHARIERRGSEWFIVDLGSRNGTRVNGKPVSAQSLVPNDRISFARTLVRFELQDAYDQAHDAALSRLINEDDLSGLLVRRKFDTDLLALLRVAEGSGTPVGLLVMDLDGIKAINDRYGHLFGAYVIGEAGRVIGRVIEGRGFGARFGGDEFTVALPGTGLGAALSVGEDLRTAIARHSFIHEGIRLSPGISVGAASFPAQATEAVALFQRADEAMYRAKAGGKGRVCA